MTKAALPAFDVLATACAGDPEFLIAAPYWQGGLRLQMGNHTAAIRIDSEP